MGQYYRPCILKKNWKTSKNPVECSLSPYDFDNGAKLMEHSYAGNGYVGAVCHLLACMYNGHPFVWCGDYADNQITTAYPKGKKDKDGDEGVSIYFAASPLCKKDNIQLLVKNLLVNNDHRKEYAYIVNYTKKQYCKIPRFNKKEWRVHPLPLLCCDGCGRGLGDYGIDDDRIGMWAYDRIGVTNSKKAIEGFTEIDGHFEMDC